MNFFSMLKYKEKNVFKAFKQICRGFNGDVFLLIPSRFEKYKIYKTKRHIASLLKELNF